jgi:hypothetical protein
MTAMLRTRRLKFAGRGGAAQRTELRAFRRLVRQNWAPWPLLLPLTKLLLSCTPIATLLPTIRTTMIYYKCVSTGPASGSLFHDAIDFVKTGSEVPTATATELLWSPRLRTGPIFAVRNIDQTLLKNTNVRLKG